jgi:hypothetical protein
MPNARAVARFRRPGLFEGKLFTLERNAYRMCRRDADSGKVERCWSFAADALVESRRYAAVWPCRSTGDRCQGRLDRPGQQQRRPRRWRNRPIVWRFAAPQGGWSAKP